MRRCTVCQVDYPDALEFCPTDGQKLPPLQGDTRALYDPLIGSTIDGRYLVDAVLGEGGMGVVYASRHAIIDKRVAIKVLRKEAAADESSAQRFLAEAKAASRIEQQNIVDITDFGVLPDGHAYFVMEFLDGVTLSKMVHKGGPLSPAAAVSIAIQVARGLSAAHDKGIIHRDLKPENIFVLDRDGIADFVKIVDFGIARDASSKKRLTVAGMVMGTPEYMAPEQASGQELDHRADQYALGCILYESITGMVPFSGENAMQTLTKHVFEPVTPPSMRRPDLTIPPPLEGAILRAMSKKREDRYADMNAFMQALQELQPSLQGIAVPIAARGSSSDSSSRTQSDSSGLEVPVLRRTPLLLFAGGIVGVAGIIGLALWANRTKPHMAETVKPVPAVTAPVPAPVERVTMRLASIPPGAEVFVDAQRIGITPTTFAALKSTEAGAKPVRFTFALTGFADAIRDVPATNDAYVDVTMQKEAGKKVAYNGPPQSGGNKLIAPVPKIDPKRTLPSPMPIAISHTEPTKPVPSEKPPEKNKKLNDLRNPFDNSPATPK